MRQARCSRANGAQLVTITRDGAQVMLLR